MRRLKKKVHVSIFTSTLRERSQERSRQREVAGSGAPPRGKGVGGGCASWWCQGCWAPGRFRIQRVWCGKQGSAGGGRVEGEDWVRSE